MHDVDDRSDPLDHRHADVQADLPSAGRRADGWKEGRIADLEGTLPLRPFTDRFYGTVAADLATTRVAALVCDAQGAIILLSLVGPDIACAAVLARVFAGQLIQYQPGGSLLTQTEPQATSVYTGQGVIAAPGDGAAAIAEVTEVTEGNAASPDDCWDGPTELRRPACLMKQFQTPLAGTRERHYLALAATADLRDVGHLAQRAETPSEAPVSAPSAPSAQGAITDIGPVGPSSGRATSRGLVSAAERSEPPLPQYVLGNATEATPAPEMVLGHLRALRLPIVPQWTPLLWAQGQAIGMITPALARGIRAWRLDTDRTRWAELLTSGVRSGWLTVP